MATEAERIARDEQDNLWFKNELLNYQDEDRLQKESSPLLLLSSKIKNSKISDRDLGKIKRCVLYFINVELENSSKRLLNSFMAFLIQSELIEDSTEIRMSLYAILNDRLERPLDLCSIEIAACLLRSKKIPSAQVLSSVLGKARQEYLIAPSWSLVGILVAGVGATIDDQAYSTNDFVLDLIRLDSAPHNVFDRAVRLRESLWTKLSPPTSSELILMRARNPSAGKTARRIESLNFDNLMERDKRSAAFI